MTRVASGSHARPGLLGRRALAGAWAIAVAASGASCAPKAGIVLPRAEAGEPSAEAVEDASRARAACRAVTTLSAELAVSGRVAGDRVRGKLLVGVAEGGRLRLEALAPFGQPVFVLVATGQRGTMILPRERKVVADVPAADLLAAMTGMQVDGADLAALLSGCVVPGGEASGGRRLQEGWSAVTLGDHRATAFLKGVAGAAPRIVGAELRPAQGAASITVGYEAFAPDGLPRRVQLLHSGRAGPLSLSLSLSQVEVGAVLEDAVFRVTVPPEFSPVTLDDVRRSSPLAQR